MNSCPSVGNFDTQFLSLPKIHKGVFREHSGMCTCKYCKFLYTANAQRVYIIYGLILSCVHAGPQAVAAVTSRTGRPSIHHTNCEVLVAYGKPTGRCPSCSIVTFTVGMYLFYRLLEYGCLGID